MDLSTIRPTTAAERTKLADCFDSFPICSSIIGFALMVRATIEVINLVGRSFFQAVVRLKNNSQNALFDSCCSHLVTVLILSDVDFTYCIIFHFIFQKSFRFLKPIH